MSDEPNWLEFFEDRERLWADYYLDFAEQNVQRDREAYDRLEEESGNLLRVGDWLAEHNDAESILSLATALWQKSDFLRTRGYLQRGLPLLEQACQAAQDKGDVEAEFNWLEALAHVHQVNGDPVFAQPLYEQAFMLAQASDAPTLKAHAQLGLGQLFMDMGDLDKAVTWLKQALQTCREVGAHEYEIEVITNLGNALSLQGEFNTAIAYLEQELPSAQSRQDRRGEAELHHALGFTAALAEDWSQAIIHFDAATNIAQEIGDRFREIRGLHNLGEALLAVGNIQKSVTILEEAVERQEAIDDIITKTYTHFYLAKAYRALHALDDCLTQLEQTYPFRQVPVSAALAAEAEWIKAEIYLEQGNVTLAKTALQDILNLTPEHIDDIRNQAKLLLDSLEHG